MNWPAEISGVLNIKYPIIQAPMLGITTPEMVAAVSNAGGLGSLPIGGLSPEKALELIQKTKSLSGKPFAVNLFAHPIPPEVGEEEFNKMQSFLRQLCAADGIYVDEKYADSLKFYSSKEQIDVLISENIGIISFTFGIPDDESIQRLQANKAILTGTATSFEEAHMLDQKGIDIICLQGIEAGGHRGSFLEVDNPPQINLKTLMKEIIPTVAKPIIAAGAIATGYDVIAAFDAGAKAVQVGTLFIASDESQANESWKKAVQDTSDTILTNAFTGRWARGLENKLIKEVEQSGLKIPGYPVQNELTGPIRAESKRQNNTDYIAMWRGQSPAAIEVKGSAEIFNQLVEEIEQLM